MKHDIIKFPGGKISGMAEAAIAVAVVLVGYGALKFLSRSKAEINGAPSVNVNVGPGASNGKCGK